MTVDANVQKLTDDVNAMATALQEVLGALTGAEGQILTLQNEVANLTQGGIGADNIAALQTAASALEASIASAKAAIPGVPAPAANTSGPTA